MDGLQIVDRSCGATTEKFQNLVNLADRPDVELSQANRFDNIVTQNEMLYIGSGDANALVTRKPLFTADIEKAFDFFIHAANGLDFSSLIDGTGQRQILSQRSDILVVGDRFVFQSEVLFPKGQAELNAAGQEEMLKLAEALKQLEREIPEDIGWVLRVDGHTDNDPIQSPQFRSNWELSTARAIAVVKFLISAGVAPQHLVAAGFGEFQPIDPGSTEEAKSRNRRIELKLTER